MFTGIVQALGEVLALQPRPDGARLLVDPRGWGHRPEPGESIAVNGCCLTAVDPGPGASPQLAFDVVPQTLRVTTLGRLDPGDRVNLEHAATPATLLGGHLVQGHVEGVGRAVRVAGPPDAPPGAPDERRLRVTPPRELLEFLSPRGSVAVDGVSLTLADVAERHFDVVLIPTTLARTNLARVGDEPVDVNLEADSIVRAVITWAKRAAVPALGGSSP